MAHLSAAQASIIKKAIHDKKLPSLEPGTIWITKWAGKSPARDQVHLIRALDHAADCAIRCKAGMYSSAADEWREAIGYYRMHKRLQARKPSTKKK